MAKRGRVTAASLSRALDRADPRNYRNAQSGLTTKDVDAKTVDYRNGRLTVMFADQVDPVQGTSVAPALVDSIELLNNDQETTATNADLAEAVNVLNEKLNEVLNLRESRMAVEVNDIRDKLNELLGAAKGQ